MHVLVKNASPAFFSGPFRYWKGNLRSPWSLLQAELPQLSWFVFIGLVLQPSDHLSGLLWTQSDRFLSLCWVLCSRWGFPHQSRAQGQIPPSPCWLFTLLSMQPTIALCAAGALCLLILSFSSTNNPKSFSSEQLSAYFLPSLYLCLQLS